MSYIERFFQKKDDYQPRTGIIKLKQEFRRFGRHVHLFVESEDDYEFYRHSLQAVYRGYAFFPYDQKGKKNVIEAFLEVDWRLFPRHRILFLVDKDYDDLLGRWPIKSSNFFKTKYYSIENYFVTTKTIQTTLSRVWGLKDSKLLLEAKSAFEASHKEFVQHMLPITSCILIYRTDERHMNLDAIKMENIFFFDGIEFGKKKYLIQNRHMQLMKDSSVPKSMKSQYTDTKTLDYLVDSSGADRRLIGYRKLILHFRRLETVDDPKKILRGKYELWFFLRFLNALDSAIIADLNKEITAHNKSVPPAEQKQKYSKKFQIDNKNIFDLLGSKIDTPHDVKKFFERNRKNSLVQEKMSYISEVLRSAVFHLRMKY